MRTVKKVVKRLIIAYIIIYIVLSSMSTCFARPYDEKCGEFIAQYARDYVEKYKDCGYNYNSGVVPAYWDGGSDGQGTFQVCCSI